MVRCNDFRCPLKQDAPRVSFGRVALSIGVVTAVVMLISVAAFSLTSQQEPRGARLTPVYQVEPADQPPPREQPAAIATGSDQAWLTRLLKGNPAPAAATTGAALPDDDTPDPAARSRVQTFSCDGSGLSAARAKICTNWTLATTDYNLNLYYRQRLAASKQPEELRRLQAQWQHRLDNSDASMDALLALYRAWFSDLDRLTQKP